MEREHAFKGKSNNEDLLFNFSSKLLFHLSHSTCSVRHFLGFLFWSGKLLYSLKRSLTFWVVSKQDMLLFDQFHNISLTQVAFYGTSMVDRLPTQTTGRNIIQSVSNLMDT